MCLGVCGVILCLGLVSARSPADVRRWLLLTLEMVYLPSIILVIAPFAFHK
jgi:hypothetical protein